MFRSMKTMIILLVILALATGIAIATDSTVYGDKIGIFKDIRVQSDTNMNGAVVSIFADSHVQGNVNGDVVAIFGSVNVDGTVDGTVVSIFGRIDMGPNATITRDKVQIIGGAGSRPDTSRVMGGEINIFYFDNFIPGLAGFAILIMIIIAIKSILGFILSLILIAIAPEKMDKITDSIVVNIPRKFGIGLLVMIAYWLFMAIGAAVVIGIPLIPIVAIVMTLVGFAGNTAVKLAIGRKIGKSKNWSNITQLVVGTLIYLVLELTLILKPVLYLAKIAGVGAITDTKIGTVDYWDQNSKKDIPASNLIENQDKSNEFKDDNKDKE